MYHIWKGVLLHTIYVLAQPTYLAVRYLLDPEYSIHTSIPWLTVTVLTWAYIITRISIPFFTSPLRHLPCPPIERFPWGHFNSNKGRPPTDSIEDMFRDTPNDGLIALWGPFYLVSAVIPTRPDTLMEILNKHSYDWEKTWLSRKFLAKIVGEGLIIVEGDEHKAMRKVATPAFTGQNIRQLVPLIYAKGLALTGLLAHEAKQATGSVLEISTLMSRVTLDIIGAAGVGKDFATVENDEDTLAKLYATVADPNQGTILLRLFIHALLPPRMIQFLFRGTVYAKTSVAHAELRSEAQALMQEKKRAMMEKSIQQKDIIATIIRSGEFSDDYLVDQLLTFLAAGHDTTAMELTWATMLLSQNPTIQTRLRAECTSTLSNKPATEITASTFDAETMPYLTAVCNEVLRLYPVVTATERVSARPTKVGTQLIPKGTIATIPIWAINRSSDFWGEDAGQFNPDRWLDGEKASSVNANGGATSPYAFTTFLYGPRSCIGQTFARMEMKCLLAAIMVRFRVEMAMPDEEVELGGFITLKPERGMRIKFFDLQG